MCWIHTMKTFLSLMAFAFGMCLLFTMITFVFFKGQISGADTFADYLHYSISALTSGDISGMVPKTIAVKLWTSVYVLSAYVLIVYITINRITNLKFGRLG